MNNIPTESQEQQKVFEWANLQSGAFPELKLLYHVPNGSNKSIATAMKFKREGLKSGVPDIVLPIARNGYIGCYIELKRKKYSVTSKEQKEWLSALSRQGNYTCICKGAEEAINKLKWYLDIK